MSERYLAGPCHYLVYEQCYIDEVTTQFSFSKYTLHLVIDWRFFRFVRPFPYQILPYLFCCGLVFGYCIIKDHTVEPSAGLFRDINHGVSRRDGSAGILTFFLF